MTSGIEVSDGADQCLHMQCFTPVSGILELRGLAGNRVFLKVSCDPRLHPG